MVYLVEYLKFKVFCVFYITSKIKSGEVVYKVIRLMFIMPMLLLFIGLLIWIIFSFRKEQSSIKIMLLGISIILTGGIIAVDPNSNLGGIEYIFVLVGLILSILGFSKIDR